MVDAAVNLPISIQNKEDRIQKISLSPKEGSFGTIAGDDQRQEFWAVPGRRMYGIAIMKKEIASILRIQGITKSFGHTLALDEMNLELQAGEVHALAGESGSGKSTLMNILSGNLQPDHGSMEIDGRPFQPKNPFDAHYQGIALIPQKSSLCPHLTVAENILPGAAPFGHDWTDGETDPKRTLEALHLFDHPEITPERTVSDLSPGERQVVEICRALAADASILLMDEPTGGLIRQDAERLFQLIRRLRNVGIGILYSSSIPEEICRVADRCTILRDGKYVRTEKMTSLQAQDILTGMAGSEDRRPFPVKRNAPSRKILLSVQKLSLPPVIEEASFELRQGEILGVFGRTGAERSGLIRALFGLKPSTGGTITVRGKVLERDAIHPRLLLAQGFAYFGEDRDCREMLSDLSVTKDLSLTRFDRCCCYEWISLQRQREHAPQWIDRLTMRLEDPSASPASLSADNRPKSTPDQIPNQEADILLMDNPTQGIDRSNKTRLYEAMAEYTTQGKAVLLVSSHLPELFGMCDRLAVMSRGRLGPVRPMAEWTRESVLQEEAGRKETPSPEFWANPIPASYA